MVAPQKQPFDELPVSCVYNYARIWRSHGDHKIVGGCVWALMCRSPRSSQRSLLQWDVMPHFRELIPRRRSFYHLEAAVRLADDVKIHPAILVTMAACTCPIFHPYAFKVRQSVSKVPCAALSPVRDAWMTLGLGVVFASWEADPDTQLLQVVILRKCVCKFILQTRP